MSLYDLREVKTLAASLPDHTPACVEAENALRDLRNAIIEVFVPLQMENDRERARAANALLFSSTKPKPLLDLFS